MKFLAILVLGASALFAETVPIVDSLSADSSVAAPSVVPPSVEKAFVQCPVSDSAYTALKQNNSTCLAALSVSMNAQMDAKKNMAHDPQVMMTSAMSFISGLGVGALLFWLIFGR